MILDMALFLVYFSIAGVLCFAYKYIASEYDFQKSEYEKGSDSTIAVLTGLFWPVVAALSFGILFAKRRRMKKDD